MKTVPAPAKSSRRPCRKTGGHGRGAADLWQRDRADALPVADRAGDLRLTTAQFFSPTGREMAGAGVEPDVHVDRRAGGRACVLRAGSPDRHDVAYDHELYGHRDGARITKRLIATEGPIAGTRLRGRTEP